MKSLSNYVSGWEEDSENRVNKSSIVKVSVDESRITFVDKWNDVSSSICFPQWSLHIAPNFLYYAFFNILVAGNCDTNSTASHQTKSHRVILALSSPP
jgi:hypothetical protein